MLKIIKYFFGSIFILIALLSGAPVQAHELLPQEVIQYLEENPNATPEQIQDYVEQVSPELADKYESKEALVEGVIGSQNLGFFPNAWLFIIAGFDHILSGLDHILFVLSLLLVFISLNHILKLTAAFTVAHSITLILAGSAIFSISSNIVEPIIALSISFVALTSVYLKKYGFEQLNKKIIVVFLFGLFHGLGFAGLLQEIQIPEDKFVFSLIFFNVGIELGQIAIILLVLPAIYYFKDRVWYSKAMIVLATLFGITGIFWAVQRIFF